MKLLVLLPTIALAHMSFAQWNAIYLHADYESAMAVLNKDTLVTVTNEGGRIHRSTDGGQSWSFSQTLFTGAYTDVDFPTDLVGYACGGSAFGEHKEFIAKTMDGGQTWDSLTSDANGNFYYFTQIRFINADTGFVIPMNGPLYKTTNGGLTFDPLPLIDPQMLAVNNMAIKPNGEIFVSLRLTQGPGLTSCTAYRSNDLGVSWTEVLACNEGIGTMFFVDDNIGYAIGADGVFLKTTDGGTTWTCTFISPFTDLTAIHFTSPTVGYINNAGGIYRTNDGGASWVVQNISQLSIIHKIQFANDSIGYALGDVGVYKTNNGGQTSGIDDLDEGSLFSIYPNPVHDKIMIDHPEGLNGTVVIFDQQGQALMECTASQVLDVSFLSEGIYFLTITMDKQPTTLRFVKQ